MHRPRLECFLETADIDESPGNSSNQKKTHKFPNLWVPDSQVMRLAVGRHS
ncbi:hypothetical protein GGD41_005124 [Paraburkholderia bryophila]|uniref:Uncharacterized protein n=1 Tax=Paraburkholderia bryophila TaxID=420952 RepID=A0A7Y9WCV7_9BURK|nr:hypothetical protein [Paraburkholderia bryophila]